MAQLRTGVIGLGTFGQWHVRAYSELENAKLVAVADVDQEKARTLSQRYGVEAYDDYQLLLQRDDIDAVSVVLPDHLHKQACVAAAQAGKHILVEKPLATSVADAEVILQAVEDGGVRLMVDFANRWNPPFLHARQAIASGELGEPLYMYLKLNDTLAVPTQMLRWSAHSSAAWFLGSHCVDLVRWLLADEVGQLRAISRSRILQARGIDTADFYQVVLEFSSGAVVNLENSWVLPTANPTVFEFSADIVGSQGRVTIDTAQHGCMRKITNTLEYPDVLMFNEVDGKLAGFGMRPIAHFLACLQNGQQFEVTPADALEAVRLVEAIEQSAAAGGKVIKTAR